MTALVTGAIALASTAPAVAANPFPVEESFQNTGFSSPNWRKGEAAELTASTEGEGKGWLRLTPSLENKFGFAYYNEAFPSTNGVQAEFEYADYGGTGADGLTFFLFNGTTTEKEFHAGQPGGSLGYASCEPKKGEFKAGLKNAYIGIGFDEFGNFTNLGEICRLDGKEKHANYVSVRGSEAAKYKLLEGASKETTQSLKAERAQSRRVAISITSEGKLSVYIRYPDETVQTVVENLQLKEKMPETLKFGFVGSTGGSTDNHEIRKSRTAKPTELVASVKQTAGGHERGEELTWTAVVKNEGPNPTQSEKVTTSTGEQALEAVSWTCTGTENAKKEKAECATVSGSGLPTNVSAGVMPIGTSLEYHIKGTPTSEANYAQMTLETEPTGDTGEINPANEKATVKTNLTPQFNKAPSFTLASNGKATAVAGTALGGEVSYTYHWQRCEPNGESCVNIAGAEALTYTTVAADRGHTIRFTQTATNSAASTTAVTPAWPLPKTTITEAPAAFVSSKNATLKFTTETKEATFECKLDAGEWAACTSPKEYKALAEGKHTFSVRAVYGGLVESSPPTAEWTIEATAPAKPTITPEGTSPSPNNHEKFTFGGLVAGDTLECKLDSGEFKVCTSPQEFTGLADGEHKLEARQKNKAGLNSEVASYKWKVEATPPARPTITPEGKPFSPNNHEKFTFGGLVAGDTLECKLDSGEFKVCTSPQEFTGLSEGEHTVEARQKNKAGVNSEPASYKWTVEATAPAKPEIKPAHSSPSPTNHESFTFGALVIGGTLECKLATEITWKVCTNPQEFTSLADGEHTVEARQKNRAGLQSEVASSKWKVEATPPAKPTITPEGKPFSPNNHEKFTFGGLVAGDTLECKLDSGEFKVCTSPQEFTGLSEGERTVEARQKNKAGVTSEVASYKWTVEATPPAKPTITPEGSSPSPNSHEKFTFGGLVAGDTLECKLDSGEFKVCTSPQEFTGLSEGEHTVEARQKNKAGVESEVASYKWTIEATAPAKPTITPEGTSPSPNNHEKFTFGGLVAGDTLECKLDSGEFKVCTSPQEFTGLADGEHKLEARQKNKAGLNSEVASYKWKVEATPPARPTITPEGKPFSPNNHEKFTFGGIEEGAALECRVDGGSWRPCSATTELSGLSNGEHTVEARQVSKSGVLSGVTSYKWTVTNPSTPSPTGTHGAEPTQTPAAESEGLAGSAAGRRAAAGLALQCARGGLVLIDVLIRNNRVALLGAADHSLAGQTVAINLTSLHQLVAAATVGADGIFQTTAPLPPANIRFSNKALYQAAIGGLRSAALKLVRRMHVTSMSVAAGRVTMRGQITLPLAQPIASVVVERRTSCTHSVVVAHATPRANGTFVVKLRAPRGTLAAVYTAQTRVRGVASNPITFPTSTLPRVVVLE